MSRVSSSALLKLMLHSLLPLVLCAICALAAPAADATPPASPAATSFDMRKEATVLRKDIDAVRAVLDQAGGNAPLGDKQKAIDRFSELKTEVQSFSDRAIAAGKTDDDVGDLLERFQYRALSTMERDLRAAINESAKPKQ